MAERIRALTDPELERALVALGGQLAAPPDPGPALAVAVRHRIQAGPERAPARRPLSLVVRGFRPSRRAVVIALAAVLALALAVAAATLELRGVRVVVPPPGSSPSLGPSSPAPLGEGLLLGERLTLAEARARVSFPVSAPTLAGLPAPEVYFTQQVPGGQVSFVYASGPGLPGEGGSTVGLLVTEFEARPDQQFLEKMAAGGTVVQKVAVEGEPGYWFTGQPHDIAYLDPAGLPFQDTVRLAGHTLVFQRGAVTVRVEGGLTMTKAFALSVARSMR
jgi:hypothetical protein